MKLMLIAFLTFINSTSNELNQVRKLYVDAVKSKEACENLINRLNKIREDDALLQGYRGSGIIIMAKHVINPISKYSNFKKGRDILEKAVTKDKNNIELRFLRLMIQSNLPKFLGYKSNISEDLEFIDENLNKEKDLQLKEFISSSLKNNKLK